MTTTAANPGALHLFAAAQGVLAGGASFHGDTRQGPPGYAGFSLAHSEDDFAETLTVVEAVAREMVG